MEEKTIISEEEYKQMIGDQKISEDEIHNDNKEMIKIEEEGKKYIVKYFDRINDRLFTFNGILIAGYFALPRIDESIPSYIILIPIVNLCWLIYIEYRMMEKSRFESKIREKDSNDVEKWRKNILNTNLFSLIAILTTLCVTIGFLAFLLL